MTAPAGRPRLAPVIGWAASSAPLRWTAAFAERVRPFDTARLDYVIAQGERAMQAQLPFLQRAFEAAAQVAPSENL